MTRARLALQLLVILAALAAALAMLGGCGTGAGAAAGPHPAPGGACLACHVPGGASPLHFSAAGSLYAAPGAAAEAVRTGAAFVTLQKDAAAWRVTPGADGNGPGDFSFPLALAVRFPATATVCAGTPTTPGPCATMAIPAPHGDCNWCHTQPPLQGAPGRLFLAP